MNLDDFEGANLPARSEILSRKGIVVCLEDVNLDEKKLRKVDVVLRRKLELRSFRCLRLRFRAVKLTTATASTCFIRYYRKKISYYST